MEPVVEVVYWPRRQDRSEIPFIDIKDDVKSIGLVMGWKTEKNARETYVVAGILPLHATEHSGDGSVDHMQAECHRIQSQLSDFIQSAINKEEDNEDSKYIECRSTFSILALWENPLPSAQSLPSIYHPSEPKRLLPWLTLGEGVPIIVQDATVPRRIPKQVVFYPIGPCQPRRWKHGSMDYIVLWDHPKSTSWRQRSQNTIPPILVQLTHAPVFLSMVTATNTMDRTVEPSRATPTRESKRPDGVQSEWLETLGSNSLLVRHWVAQGVPLVRLCYRRNERRAPSSPYDAVRFHLVQKQALVILWMDVLLGALCSFWLLSLLYHDFTNTPPLKTSIQDRWIFSWIQQHYRHLNRYIEWLEHFPLGFKLNQSLLYNVGREVQRLWNIHEKLVLYVTDETLRFLSSNTISQKSFLFILSLLSLSLGGSGCVALLFDLMRFCTMHMSIVAWFTIRLYAGELYLLSTFWLLFCGRKRNILRQRIDSIEYDAMQLLLGTILFTMVLFLFTTIFVGHIFYTLLYLITVGGTLPFALLYIWLQYFPWAILWFRQQNPGWFAQEIYVMDDDDLVHSDGTLTVLNYRADTYRGILIHSVISRWQTTVLWFVTLAFRSLIGSASSWSDFLDTIIPQSSVNPNCK